MATASKQAKAPMAQGIGESRTFIAPEGTFEPQRDWSLLTLNGSPIPEHLHGLISYELTDQGFEERNAGKEPVRVKVLREGRDNAIARRRDELADRPVEDQSGAYDPLKELADQHVGPGFKPRFLSDYRVGKEGGTRGFEICKDADGEPVKFGRMVLAKIPEGVADQRRAALAEKSAQQIAAIETTAKENSLREV